MRIARVARVGDNEPAVARDGNAGQPPESRLAPEPSLKPGNVPATVPSAEIRWKLDDPAALVADVGRAVGIEDDADRTQRDAVKVSCERRNRTGSIDPANGAVAAVGDVDVASCIDGNPARRIESRLVHGAVV